MIKQLSNNVTSFLVRQDTIQKEEQEIYAYGLEYIISIALSIAGISIIAVGMGFVFETMGFIIGFISIRSAAGGYHAKTHTRCQIVSYAVYIGNMFMLKAIEEYLNCTIIASLAILATLTVFVFAPMDHPNKPFSKDEYTLFKRKSRRMVLAMGVLVLMMSWIFQGHHIFFSSVIFGVLTAALSLIAAKLTRKETEYEKN